MPAATEQTLYKQTSKGDIQIWKVKVVDNIIYIEYGKLNGKHTATTKTIKGKNIGKSNETTPTQQAFLEAQSMMQKKMDSNYFTTIDEARNNIEFRPMLATVYKGYVTFPAFVQPKLDGVRCIAYRNNDGDIVLKSRNGKEYDLPHIRIALENVLVTNCILDGEIFNKDMSFQEITSLVKRPRVESQVLQYWVYDMYCPDNHNLPFHDRYHYIRYNDYNSTVVMTPTETVFCSDDITDWHSYYLERGFEGTIIRDANDVYAPGRRSKGLMKLKDFDDDEFMIVGVKSTRQQGVDVPLFTCVTKNGQKFSVFQSGTLEDKNALLKQGDDLIGEMLKVKHFGYTDDNIPRFPVGIGIRMRGDM